MVAYIVLVEPVVIFLEVIFLTFVIEGDAGGEESL